MVRAGGYDAPQAARSYAGLRCSKVAEALSNGALLRVFPIGIAYRPEPAWDAALRDAALTHSDPLCHIATALYAATLSFAIRSGGDREAVLAWAEESGDSAQRARGAAGGFPGAFGSATGVLAGALASLRKLPRFLTDRVLTARPIAGLPGVRNPRPSDCWATDALYIAERLAMISTV